MKLAIFDVDGTLLDNLTTEDTCYIRALREGLGLTIVDGDWSTYEHVTDEGVAVEAYHRAHGRPPSHAAIAETIDRFVQLLADAHRGQPISAVPGAIHLLATLRRHGWIPALATGAWRRAAELKLQGAGIAFDDIVLATAEDGPARVDIVRAAIARAAADAAMDGRLEPLGRSILVGDGPWDVDAARAMHLPFVGRGTGTTADRLARAGAATILEDFMDLSAVLEAFDAATIPGQ